MKELRQPNNNFFIVLGIILAGFLVVLAISLVQVHIRTAGLSDNIKLVVPKEDIVNYKLISDSAGKPVVLYRYVTNEEAPPLVFQGFEEDLSKRTPNSQTFLKSVEEKPDGSKIGHYVGRFYPQPVAEQRGDKWYQVDTATTTESAFYSQTRLTLLDYTKELFGHKVLADTFYSGAGDGYVSDAFGGSTWNDIHDNTTGSTADYTSGSSDFLGGAGFISKVNLDSGGEFTIYRAFIPFDTSSISSSANISSASLNLYSNGLFTPSIADKDNDGMDYYNIVQTTQPSSSSLTTADYDLCGDAVTNPTTGATAIDITNITTSAYNTFTLNSTGLSWIKKSGESSTCGGGTGVTCLGLREGHDIEDVPVDVAGDTGGAFRSSEATDTSKDPYLLVNYAAAADSVKINGSTLKINGNSLKIN